MHDGVASPRPPRLRQHLCLLRGHAPEVVAHRDVFLRERVGPAQGAHGNVVRRPRADAGQLGQPPDGIVWIVMRAAVEAEPARTLRVRQRDDAPAARRDDAVPGDVIDAGRSDPGRDGCEAIQFRKRRDDGLTERLDEPAGDGGGRFHRHLLAEDRAQPELEAVEGAGHAQAGVRLDGRREARVPAQMFRDQVGPRVEIEQRPDAAEQRRQHGRQAVRELDHQRVLLLRLRHLDPALRLSQLHGPGIRAVGHVLDAFERPGREKGEHAVPVVRRTIRELQGRRLALGDRGRVFGRLPASRVGGIP